MPPIITFVVAVVAAVVSGFVCFFAGSAYRRKTAEAKLGSAEEEAKRIVNDAIKAAEQKRKETVIEAKDEALRMKTEADKEIKERRNELSRQERRLDQKEEALDSLLPEAARIFIESGQASISLLQRRLRIGYTRAARIIDQMEEQGIVGGYEGSKARAIRMTMEQYEERFGKSGGNP